MGTLNHSAIDSKNNYTKFPKSMLNNSLIKARFERLFIGVNKTLNDAIYLTSFHATLYFSFLNQEDSYHIWVSSYFNIGYLIM